MDKTNFIRKNPIPYLHPGDRVLRSEQIGLSNHKNQFKSGALMGNWVEERRTEEFNETVSLPSFNMETVQQTSFRCPQDLNSGSFKREGAGVNVGLEKEIIFGHGNDLHDYSFVTMNQLVNAHQESLKTEKAIQIRESLSPKSQSLLEKRRKEWNDQVQQERDLNNSFITTYKAEVTSVAEDPNALKEALRKDGRKTTQWGESTHLFGKDYHKMELRTPLPLELSPFAKTNNSK